MVVVSLSSIPPRLVNLHQTITSLLNQTVKPDRIVLNIPYSYHRYPGVTVEVPNFTELSTETTAVIINRCQDYGPATKLLGLLANSVPDPDEPIIVVDDDRSYRSDLVASFLTALAEHPDCAITGLGGSAKSFLPELRPQPPTQVGFTDVLQGYGGYLVKAKYFDGATGVFNINPDSVEFWVDDIWLSGFVRLAGVKIWNLSMADSQVNDNINVDPLVSTREASLEWQYKTDVWAKRLEYNAKLIKWFQEKYGIWL